MRDLGKTGRIVGGSIRFKGRDLTTMPDAELRKIRGSEIAMIYQEPMASLNPAMKVGRQLMEVPMIHEGASAADAYAQALRVVEAVRLPDPRRILGSYPHQLSGGQQQRIVIAMALMSKPSLLILDEPTTALDVTVEAGIVELVKDLGRDFGTSMLFISHNLGLVLETCDRICVMYSGEAVETGPIAEVFDEMRHPYTQGLFRSIPLPGADKTRRPLVADPGQLPPAPRAPAGLQLRPALQLFRQGPLRRHGNPDGAGDADPRHAAASAGRRSTGPPPPRAPGPAPAARAVGDVVLSVDELKKYYEVGSSALFGGDTRVVKANESVSFEAREAETLAIVGEVGLRQVHPRQGAARPRDRDRRARSTSATWRSASSAIERRDTRTVASIQMVFQNPFDTLNPSHSIGGQIVRVLEKFRFGKHQRRARGADARAARPRQAAARLRPPHAAPALGRPEAAHRHRPRLRRRAAGGGRRRAGLRARRLGAGGGHRAPDGHPARPAAPRMLFISHDLGIVRYLADRVMVMYLGHVVEIGTTDQVFEPPYHPYTEALLSAVPIADTRVREGSTSCSQGDIPSAVNPPPGCPFQTRCPRKHQVPGDLCETEVPPMRRARRRATR